VVDRRNGIERRQNDLQSLNGKNTILTTQEACMYLRISRPTYLKYICEGKISAQKIGRGWKVFKSELDRFLRGL
jgi:excisionase family DNA binding protein